MLIHILISGGGSVNQAGSLIKSIIVRRVRSGITSNSMVCPETSL
jgi:hypothetical protein